MDLLYHSTASNTILGSLVTREQCVAYIPMPKGRGITPRVIKKRCRKIAAVLFAIRIEVNQELTVLSESLDGMIDLLNDGGRLCVITFHSLEDRIVKNIFRKNEHPCTCPPEFPVCICGKKSKGTVVTRKPILPGEEEMETNPRSKSAKLRVFERKV